MTAGHERSPCFHRHSRRRALPFSARATEGIAVKPVCGQHHARRIARVPLCDRSHEPDPAIYRLPLPAFNGTLPATPLHRQILDTSTAAMSCGDVNMTTSGRTCATVRPHPTRSMSCRDHGWRSYIVAATGGVSARPENDILKVHVTFLCARVNRLPRKSHSLPRHQFDARLPSRVAHFSPTPIRSPTGDQISARRWRATAFAELLERRHGND